MGVGVGGAQRQKSLTSFMKAFWHIASWELSPHDCVHWLVPACPSCQVFGRLFRLKFASDASRWTIIALFASLMLVERARADHEVAKSRPNDRTERFIRL